MCMFPQASCLTTHNHMRSNNDGKFSEIREAMDRKNKRGEIVLLSILVLFGLWVFMDIRERAAAISETPYPLPPTVKFLFSHDGYDIYKLVEGSGSHGYFAAPSKKP